MSLRDDIKRQAHDMERAKAAAQDLWLTLPSCAAATRWHGPKAGQLMPPINRVMIEATCFIAHGLLPTHEQLEIAKLAGNVYACPCGKPHDDTTAAPAEPVASFESFVRELQGDIARFARHWSEQHRADPERFPMSFHKDNPGAWFEQFMAFVNSERGG